MQTTTTSAQRPTAKIYQFPVRKRATTAESSEAVRIRSALAMSRAAAAALGSAWYHEEALGEDEPRLGA
jgi:hypothetical protein